MCRPPHSSVPAPQLKQLNATEGPARKGGSFCSFIGCFRSPHFPLRLLDGLTTKAAGFLPGLLDGLTTKAAGFLPGLLDSLTIKAAGFPSGALNTHWHKARAPLCVPASLHALLALQGAHPSISMQAQRGKGKHLPDYPRSARLEY